ncbi:NAD-P-binding protein [Trametes versicolor FP-101664 SS1]|uniref:NAD-P-binding protein n=1 Tax=Trametes versicolor (strain FP-101664) TaxID=717944 RepID=R7S7P5_TRAVS|nr:NAD-P-binding protein [Trametes versicolor FP-101664 SS1]EIW52026.1 NAD-P-binding protein [Trametes versicolor FP-101664 SS1]
MGVFTHFVREAQFSWTFARHLFPGKPSWTADHLPDLSSKVFVVTGGNTGIGRGTVRGLLLKNAKVYIAARSKDRVEHAITELREETGREALFLQLDLGDLSSVKKAAEEFKQRESQLDGLILNAGVLYPSKDALTAQGYDATIGVNVVGHFLLHRLLYSLLSASGRESDTSRVIWLSSIASYKPHSLTYETFREGPERQHVDSIEMYAESKVAVVMLSTYLAKTCVEDNVSSIAVDPGNIKSEIYRSSPWYLKLWVSALDWLYWYPVEYGAISSLYAGAAPEGAGCNGKVSAMWPRSFACFRASV